jgi:hypothetical protein
LRCPASGTVTDIIAKFANSHEKRLQNHINIEASRLLKVKKSPDDSNGRNRLNKIEVEEWCLLGSYAVWLS